MCFSNFFCPSYLLSGRVVRPATSPRGLQHVPRHATQAKRASRAARASRFATRKRLAYRAPALALPLTLLYRRHAPSIAYRALLAAHRRATSSSGCPSSRTRPRPGTRTCSRCTTPTPCHCPSICARAAHRSEVPARLWPIGQRRAASQPATGPQPKPRWLAEQAARWGHSPVLVSGENVCIQARRVLPAPARRAVQPATCPEP